MHENSGVGYFVKVATILSNLALASPSTATELPVVNEGNLRLKNIATTVMENPTHLPIPLKGTTAYIMDFEPQEDCPSNLPPQTVRIVYSDEGSDKFSVGDRIRLVIRDQTYCNDYQFLIGVGKKFPTFIATGDGDESLLEIIELMERLLGK